MQKMKAITIWQPWASLLVSGQKQYETRSWATSYRGPIAIHAAMRPVRRTIGALAAGNNILERLGIVFPKHEDLYQLPTGAIVGTAILEYCHLIDETFIAKLSLQELDLGEFTPGRYAWEFSHMTDVTPAIPIRGAQGLWTWDEIWRKQ